jgi:parallel beta-helix repeat protein
VGRRECPAGALTQWADGISLSCANSTVYNNTIVDATDGGIVIFGAPYSVVRENRIRAATRVMLGGINREL